MTSRERVEAALAFEPVDKAPLEYHPYRPVSYTHLTLPTILRV